MKKMKNNFTDAIGAAFGTLLLYLFFVGGNFYISELFKPKEFDIKKDDCVCLSDYMVDNECFKEHMVYKVGTTKVVLNDNNGEPLVLHKDELFSNYIKSKCDN